MISSITKKQEALIPTYIEKWVNLASQPIDRKKLKGIFKKIYGKEKLMVIGESFQNTIDLIHVAVEGRKLEYDSKLHSKLDSKLDSKLNLQLRSQLDLQLRPQLYSKLDLQLRPQLYSQLDLQLYSKLHSQLRPQLDSQLHSQLHSQLDLQNIKYSSYISYYLYDWAGYYDYAEKIGVEFNKVSLEQYFDILLNIPIVIFIGDVIFVCEKPICQWSNSLLHSDIKPAIGWKDGTGFYYLNGVRFEKELWERITSFRVSKEMPFEEILAIQDMDQRTQAMAYGSVDKFFAYTKAELLDKSERGNALYRIPRGDIFTEDAYYLKYPCPSTGKIYMSGVPKEIGEKKDADNAMAWKHWLSPEGYKLLELVNEG